MASVGKHIRRIRTERHMTQEQLAEKLFVTRQAVSAWETVARSRMWKRWSASPQRWRQT